MTTLSKVMRWDSFNDIGMQEASRYWDWLAKNKPLGSR